MNADQWRIEDTADYVCSRNFSVVTLQFPDEYLDSAAEVCRALQASCQGRGHAIQAYILADTTYNSLSVDEVAAAHVNAQCVIHYGRASLTKLSRLPAFFVFPQQLLDVQAAAAALAGSSLFGGASTAPVLVFLDQPLLQQLPEFSTCLAQQVEQRHGTAAARRLVFPTVPQQHMEPEQRAAAPPPRSGCCGEPACGSQQPAASAAASCCRTPPAWGDAGGDQQSAGMESAADIRATQGVPGSASSGEGNGGGSSVHHALAGYQWRLHAGVQPQDCGLAWVGASDAPALLQLQLTHSGSPWAVLDPALLPPPTSLGSGGSCGSPGAALREGLPLETSRALRRRYYLVQRAREARVVGILVGTLGAAGYADAVAALRAAAAAAGKKSYTLLMGKPSPAKLANFPEIEVFVLVADPQGQILDSKEYLAPIITPHEAALAFAPGGGEGQWDERAYRLDFDGVVAAAAAAGQAAADEAGGPGSQRGEPRFSLVAGGRYTGPGGDGSGSDDDGSEGRVGGGADDTDTGVALALRAQQALQVSAAPAGRSDLVEHRSAADYLLHKRSWTGVEAPLVGAPHKAAELAAEGRSGRAAGYADEPGQRQGGGEQGAATAPPASPGADGAALPERTDA